MLDTDSIMNIKIVQNLEKIKLTPFQWRVLRLVQKSPLGEPRTYQWVAQEIGQPGAARAVGTALRKNPFPLIIPCHRVVSVSGLGGYMGETSGECLEIKRKLVAIESYNKIY